MATLKACLRLWLGFGPARSGVFSAGNGPAMRSPLLGVLFHNDLAKLVEFNRASTRITHTDPQAEIGALLVAVAAGAAASGEDVLGACRRVLHDRADSGPWPAMMDRLEVSVRAAESTADFSRALSGGRGTSGYILHTVPVALHAYLTHREYRSTVLTAIACGGDTDTVAAIAGAIAGAANGPGGIPPEWLDGYIDWPLSRGYLERLGNALADSAQAPLARFAWWGVPPRNALFIVVVLLHGLRRCLPPY